MKPPGGITREPLAGSRRSESRRLKPTQAVSVPKRACMRRGVRNLIVLKRRQRARPIGFHHPASMIIGICHRIKGKIRSPRGMSGGCVASPGHTESVGPRSARQGWLYEPRATPAAPLTHGSRPKARELSSACRSLFAVVDYSSVLHRSESGYSGPTVKGESLWGSHRIKVVSGYIKDDFRCFIQI